jgi:hypothetical protein
LDAECAPGGKLVGYWQCYRDTIPAGYEVPHALGDINLIGSGMTATTAMRMKNSFKIIHPTIIELAFYGVKD